MWIDSDHQKGKTKAADNVTNASNATRSSKANVAKDNNANISGAAMSGSKPQQIDQVVVTAKPALAKKAVIVADATFWGRGYGVLVFHCPQSKKNVYWQEIITETAEVYRQAREVLGTRRLSDPGCRAGWQAWYPQGICRFTHPAVSLAPKGNNYPLLDTQSKTACWKGIETNHAQLTSHHRAAFCPTVETRARERDSKVPSAISNDY